MVVRVEQRTPRPDRTDVIDDARAHLLPASCAPRVLGMLATVDPLPAPREAHEPRAGIGGPLRKIPARVRRGSRVPGAAAAAVIHETTAPCAGTGGAGGHVTTTGLDDGDPGARGRPGAGARSARYGRAMRDRGRRGRASGDTRDRHDPPAWRPRTRRAPRRAWCVRPCRSCTVGSPDHRAGVAGSLGSP